MTPIVLLLCVLGLGPQKAPPPKIQWVPTLDEALEQAKARNAVVLLTFQRDGDKKAAMQRRSTFQNPIFVKKAIEELICVVAHRGVVSGDEHKPEPVSDPQTGSVVYKCPLYEGITCEQHKALYSLLRSRYKFKEQPATFLLGPDGKILVGSEGFSPVAFFALKKVKEAQGKLEGRTITATAYRRILKSFQQAEGKLADEKYLYAIADYRKLAKKKSLTEPLRSRAQKGLADVVKIGLQLVEKGKKEYAEDAEGGMKLLKMVRYEFKGTEAAEKAKAVIEEIEGEGK